MSLTKENGTAILIFAQSSTEDMKHKNMVNGDVLFDSLTKHTIALVEKTGLPYYHFTEKEQKGHSFGERFTNAIQTVFNKGFDSVITVGNDTPHLGVKHILEANEQLKSKKLVLGPSIDGGFYLMGLHRSQFHAHSFAQLPWQTTQLFKAVVKWSDECEIQLVRLQPLIDLDQLQDIRNLLNRFFTLPKAILGILAQILYQTVQNWIFVLVPYTLHFLHFPFNKGSPTSIAVKAY